jgi:hypothetical protein
VWFFVGYQINVRLTWGVPLVEQELLTPPEHLSSPRFLFGFVLLELKFSVLFVHLSFIFWPLRCLFFFNIRILITALVSVDHCVVCSSSIYGFWLPLWYLLTIALSVLLQYTDSDYPFGIFKLSLKQLHQWSDVFI